MADPANEPVPPQEGVIENVNDNQEDEENTHNEEESVASNQESEPEQEPEPEPDVPSDPIGRITGLPSDVLELYMKGCGITRIADFEPFVKLEVLYLNNNKISELTGLDTLRRLRGLFVQKNRISSLRGSSIRHMKFLEELNLEDNQLTDFEETLDAIRHLSSLRTLVLMGNPFTPARPYRLAVIDAFPALDILDFIPVTPVERARATRLLGDVKEHTVAFGRTIDPSDPLDVTVLDKTLPKRPEYDLLINPPQSAAERIIRAMTAKSGRSTVQAEEVADEERPKPQGTPAKLPVPAAMDFLSRRPKPPSPKPKVRVAKKGRDEIKLSGVKVDIINGL
ncbi:Leucine-rich repeat [Carpediemonas membranifera]|uniref:Leucine-rich repeat n=1 Tax=Carpediemonas membranifera TaxID=201153 RepID=A0A8J6ARW8_9EUKA|nr:Leucine-rich repeat [Carpediemonas membranifera]|eukprot:KAG9390740.1 Leucine-rich repeat [Carpediemonas membranifera]